MLPYKTMLEMTVVYNLPYGPFGSGTWFGRKHDCLQDFLAQHFASSTTFQEHLPYICRELGIPEPQHMAQQQDLFESLGKLRSFAEKGPLVKLMRWFSFFESAAFYQGELYATKMILMSAGTEYEAEQEEPAASFDHEGLASKDPRAELAELKKKKGVWKLAQLLITERNIDLQRMVMQVCRATWKHHALRARTIKSPSMSSSTMWLVQPSRSGQRSLRTWSGMGALTGRSSSSSSMRSQVKTGRACWQSMPTSWRSCCASEGPAWQWQP